MKILWIISLALALLGCRQAELPTKPGANRGVIDLRNWSFEESQPLNLEGEWEFHWSRFLNPDGSAQAETPPVYIKVPGQWQTQGFPVYGYATYRLRILLSPTAPPLALAMTNAATAYRLYINGRLTAANGEVGKNESESVPFLKHTTVELPAPLDGQSRDIDLVFHVSNFHFFQAGLWNTIKLGKTRTVEHVAQQKFVLDLVVFSSLLTMGFYHLGLYLNRRRDSTPLYFGGFCILMALRTVTLGERLVLDAWPWLPFTLVHKTEFVTLYAGAAVFTSFIESLFPVEFSRRISLAMRILFVAAAIIAVAFPMSVYGHTLIWVQGGIVFGICYFLYVLITAFLNGRTGARLFVVGFALFAVTLIIDIVKTQGFLYQIPYTASYGFLIFIVFQGAVLSRKFARAFTESENLAAELKLLSAELEAKVKDRTSTLNATLGTIRHDLSVAKTVQEQSLLIQGESVRGLEIVSRYLPMSEVGGDFYAINPVREGVHRVLLADATGHGVQAALITMAIKGFYDNLKYLDVDPGTLMQKFNSGFMERYAPLRSFLTAAIVDIDTHNQKLRYCSAGHPAALVLRNGHADLLEKRGKMIGLLSDAPYVSHEIAFLPGSRLYLFTDGVFEEFSGTGEEFGEGRVTNILLENSHHAMPQAIDVLLNHLDQFLDGKGRQDDATILGFEFKA